MIYAASATKSIGIAIAVVSSVVWLIYVLISTTSTRKEVGAEVELAPNRKPYFTDDELETRKLDRSLLMGLGALVVLGVGLPVYWLAEPGRQDGAVKNFNEEFANRGEVTYMPSTEGPNSFGCQNCHGPDGTGGVAAYTFTDPQGKIRTVQWKAPALNTALLRFSEDEVKQIITYGRAGTPMPAWGVAGGGPMNEQQISELVHYFRKLCDDLVGGSCENTASTKPTPQVDADGLNALQKQNLEAFGTDGAKLFAEFCARCHTQGAPYDEPDVQGGGAFGPNLTNGVTVRQFPDLAKMIEFITLGSDFGKGYGTRGIGSGRMPGFGLMLTPEQIEAIVDYERSL